MIDIHHRLVMRRLLGQLIKPNSSDKVDFKEGRVVPFKEAGSR